MIELEGNLNLASDEGLKKAIQDVEDLKSEQNKKIQMEASLNLPEKQRFCKCVYALGKFERCCGLGMTALQLVSNYYAMQRSRPKPKRDPVKSMIKRDAVPNVKPEMEKSDDSV